MHGSVGCVGKGKNALVTAKVLGDAPSTMRVYFHSLGATCGEYYVDMHRSEKDPSTYWAVLPQMTDEATALAYQIKGVGAGGKEIVDQPVTIPMKAECAAQTLTPDEEKAAQNITLGLTQPTQVQVPCAFKCNGVLSVMTSSHQLQPNEGCIQALAAPKPWYTTPAGIATAGAGAVAAGVLINNEQRNNKHTQPSPVRP